MSIAQRLAAADRILTQSRQASDFVGYVKHLAGAGFDRAQAANGAAARGASPGVVELLKTAVTPGATVGDWGAEIGGNYSAAVASFLESTGAYGAFEQILPSMRRVPLRSRVAVVTGAATAGVTNESMVKSVSQLTLANAQLTEQKATAIAVVSEEILKLATDADVLLASELRKAVAAATDAEFIAALISGISPTVSVGGTSTSVLQDLAAALAAINTNAASRLFIIAPAATAKAWSAKTNSTGDLAFPGVGPNGGTLGQIPVVVSDSVTSDQWIVVDASQIAAAAGTLVVDRARHSNLQLDTSPDSPQSAATTPISLWARNLVAIRCERYFGIERLRTTAVALIDNASYTGNSPN